MEPKGGILRAQLARKTGCNLETIRYYETAGLLPAPPRSANGYRVYSVAHESRLRFVIRARDLGFSMEEIRSLLVLTDSGEQTCAEVMERAQAHRMRIRQRIAELRRMEQILTDTLTRCSGGEAPDCAILDALNHD